MRSTKIIFFAFLTLASSCGRNAFIKVDNTSIIEEVVVEPFDINFYYGDSTSGLNGAQTSLFLDNLSNTNQAYIESFSSESLGKKLEVKNQVNSISYTISHLDDSAEQTKRPIYVESPVSQSGAVGDGVGLDFAYGSSTNKNTMLITFDKAVAHFGIDLLDFETNSNFTLGEIVAKNCDINPVAIATKTIDFGSEDGNGEVHFFGFIATEAIICSVQIFVGDDGLGDGKAEKFAIDNMRFGTSTLK